MVVDYFLYNAYEHIDAGNIRSAIDVLESVVCNNPLNIEAWEAYMQICVTLDELDFLYARILQVTGLCKTERDSVINYYYFLQKKLSSCDASLELQIKIKLELVDQFNFTLKDLAYTSNQTTVYVKNKRGVVWLLGKAIIISYSILLIMGLILITTGNDFGYWILLVPILGTVNYIGKINDLILLVKRSKQDNRRILDTDILK